MLHDIFSLENKSKENFAKLEKTTKISEKPIVIADIHEKDSLIFPELIKNNIDLKITYLEIADYIIGNTAIERKTINDFISSLLSKRLFEQLLQMQGYKNTILILEGEFNDCYNKININSLRGFIISIITDFKMNILYTKDYFETASYLITLANREIKDKKEFSLHSKIPRSIPEQKRYILESFPRIGPKTSKKLISEYKTLKNIFNADKNMLKTILKSRVDDFLKLLND
jgi:Fanconi anemia group M protein